MTSLREEVTEYNQKEGVSSEAYEVNFYCGQSVVVETEEGLADGDLAKLDKNP